MKKSELFFTYIKKFIEQEEFPGQPKKFGGQAQRNQGEKPKRGATDLGLVGNEDVRGV